MLVVSKPITPAPLLPYNTPPGSPSQMHLHYGQSAQHLIVEMLAAVLKIVQAVQPPLPPLPPPPPLMSLGVEKIREVRGFKVEVKVLNEMYAREIPKTYLETR